MYSSSERCINLSQGCEHNHSHTKVTDSVFKIGISLNLLFVLIEIYFGIIHDSLALVSDAIHNLTDVFGLVLAWLGYALSKNARTKKFSIYAAVINSGLLLVTSFWVIVEAYERYYAGETPVAVTMIVVAFIGTCINFFTAQQFHQDHHHDLNMKSAYLHLMADAAISLGVVVAGIIIYFKALYWIDPVLSAVISVVIIFSSWGLFREAVNMLRGKTPKNMDLEKIKFILLKYENIKAINGIKVWALSTSENALSVDIETQPKLSPEQIQSLKHELEHAFKITELSLK